MTLIDRDGARGRGARPRPVARRTSPSCSTAVTAAAGIALENARLQVELRARLEELRGSRARIVEAGQKERQRLERNLHDGAQQRLVALSLELGLLERRPGGRRREARRAARGAPGARSRRRSTSCARSPAGSTPRSSAGTGSASRSSSSPRWRRVPVELDGRARRAAAGGGRGRRVLRRLARASRTSASTRRRSSATVDVTREDGDRARRGDRRRRRRRRHRARHAACAASPTGSRRSAAGCGSGARAGGGTRVRAEIPCAP